MRVYYSIPAEYWEQGAYSTSVVLSEADIFVFAHTSNEFNLNIKQLPSGVQKELKKATVLGKSIYYLYYTMGSTIPNYYKIIMNPVSGYIAGVAGSSSRFFAELLGDTVLVDPTIKEHPLTPKECYKAEVIVPNKKMLMF